MLILTRRMDEQIRINEDITIKILAIKESQVRLGIEAPKTVSVHREEVYYRIQHEKNNRKATKDQGNVSSTEEKVS